MSEPDDGAGRSDGLVLFGASGDLARKQIFPALYAMAKRGVLNVPVIGVAYSNWTWSISTRGFATVSRRRSAVSTTSVPSTV